MTVDIQNVSPSTSYTAPFFTVARLLLQLARFQAKLAHGHFLVRSDRDEEGQT